MINFFNGEPDENSEAEVTAGTPDETKNTEEETDEEEVETPV